MLKYNIMKHANWAKKYNSCQILGRKDLYMRILIIEDEQKLCDLLEYQLKQEGFLVDCCYNGGEAFYYIEQNIYDLILLDRMLPEIDGLTILKKIRSAGFVTPVILITALSQLQEKVEGLNMGADDYLVKPFAFEELLARIHCINRRPRELKQENVLKIGDISLDPDELYLHGPSDKCSLSKRESNLMEVFVSNPHQTLPRNTLLLKVWGPDAEVEDGNLDNYIHFLRRRLKTVGSTMQLSTVRGVGYKLVDSKEN